MTLKLSTHALLENQEIMPFILHARSQSDYKLAWSGLRSCGGGHGGLLWADWDRRRERENIKANMQNSLLHKIKKKRKIKNNYLVFHELTSREPHSNSNSSGISFFNTKLHKVAKTDLSFHACYFFYGLVQRGERKSRKGIAFFVDSRKQKFTGDGVAV